MRKLLAHKYLLFIVVVYTLVVTWLSTARIILPVKINVQESDKIGHFLAYLVFALVWFSFFFYSEKVSYRFSKSLWVASVIGFLFGIIMEGCQALFTNYRSPDWNDIIANTSGIVFAVILLKFFEKKLHTFR